MEKLLIFDSHPVQYRVPVWKIIQAEHPGVLHVVYASDCSVKGHADAGFGKTFAWDDPMLEGYEFTVLNCEKGIPLSGWGSLTGDGVKEVFDKLSPTAILLTGLNYKYDQVAYKEARKRNIPVWLRCETQDFAVDRSKLKSIIRSIIYKRSYKHLSKVFYIGELNKQHYLKHGVSASKLFPALYGTINRFDYLDTAAKLETRSNTGIQAGISEDNLVVGFSGKFIRKKNPDLLYEMLPYMQEDVRKKLVLYFVGSGEMEDSLKLMAEKALEDFGVESYFSGFVNQSKIGDHYLAMDIMVLPSRRMGETWGLVVNEALQAGCGVIVSDAVGSSKNFEGIERFKVIKIEDAKALAENVEILASFERDFDWASEILKPYTIEATATALISQLI